MKKIYLFGVLFLASVLVCGFASAENAEVTKGVANAIAAGHEYASRSIIAHEVAHSAQQSGVEEKSAVADGGDNVGFCIRGVSKEDLKNLIADGLIGDCAGAIDKDLTETKSLVAEEKIVRAYDKLHRLTRSLVADGGDNFCMLTRSTSKDNLNGDEIWGRKIVVNKKVNGEEYEPIPSLNSWRDKMLVMGNGPGANGEQNCIPVLSNRMQSNGMHGTDTMVEEIEMVVEKIERS